MAGSIPELQVFADKLDEEKSMHSKKLSERIKNSVPRFEGAEEVSCGLVLSSNLYLRRARNANDGTIELHGKLLSLDRSLDFLCTKVALVGRN